MQAPFHEYIVIDSVPKNTFLAEKTILLKFINHIAALKLHKIIFKYNFICFRNNLKTTIFPLLG